MLILFCLTAFGSTHDDFSKYKSLFTFNFFIPILKMDTKFVSETMKETSAESQM